MTHIDLGTRRLGATGALTLALSLQICGCNLVPDCRRILESQLSSFASEGLMQRGVESVTARQMSSLVHAGGRAAFAGAGVYLHPKATTQHALPDEESSLSYDSGSDNAFNAAEVASEDDEVLQNVSPPTRRPPSFANSFDITFTSWPIPESVFFVYRSSTRGVAAGEAHRRVPIATAFILSVPDVDRRTVARFLVTARHVVDPQWAHCTSQNPASMEVRFNLRAGGVGYEKIPLDNTRMRRYFVPADATSDIAILRLDQHLVPHLDAYKFVDTPFSLLPTESDLRAIGAIQQVATASARAQALTGLDAFPLTGRGVLSSITSEPVDIRCGSSLSARSLSLWFIGGFVQRGVSGAPVYTSLVREGDIAPTTVLLGVQAIAWPDRGVAGITPSTVLADLVQTALAGEDGRPDFYRGATH